MKSLIVVCLVVIAAVQGQIADPPVEESGGMVTDWQQTKAGQQFLDMPAVAQIQGESSGQAAKFLLPDDLKMPEVQSIIAQQEKEYDDYFKKLNTDALNKVYSETGNKSEVNNTQPTSQSQEIGRKYAKMLKEGFPSSKAASAYSNSLLGEKQFNFLQKEPKKSKEEMIQFVLEWKKDIRLRLVQCKTDCGAVCKNQGKVCPLECKEACYNEALDKLLN